MGTWNIHHITYQSPVGAYLITTDGRYKQVGCEKGRCKIKKCVNIRAPVDLFPKYNLPNEAQCEMVMEAEGAVYVTVNMTECDAGDKKDLKFKSKTVNKYAAALTKERKLVLIDRLCEIALSLLVFNGCILLVALWNGVKNHQFSLRDLCLGDGGEQRTII
eukprot:sb/3472844/